MISDIDLQRRRDGAFFEDWSEWHDLGTPPRHYRTRDGFYVRTGNHHTSYHCLLRERLPYDGRAGFEVAVPQATGIYNLLRKVPGAAIPCGIPKGGGAGFDLWYVPAESWQELRKVLPAIKAKTMARMAAQ